LGGGAGPEGGGGGGGGRSYGRAVGAHAIAIGVVEGLEVDVRRRIIFAAIHLRRNRGGESSWRGLPVAVCAKSSRVVNRG
jgi:hypothetical protein